MLKELLKVFGGNGALEHIYNNFDEMIGVAQEMFLKATDTFTENNRDYDAYTKEIYRMDGRLNTLQQQVRREIVIHISVNGTTDILPCLQLMSLVKDAERLGDYAKNILETSKQFDQYGKDPHYGALMSMTKNIVSWFDETSEAVEKQDKEAAAKMIEKAYDYEKQCDEIILKLINMGSQASANPVAMALQLRYLKRIIAHLGNIMSSIVMPIDKLDYYDEG